MKSKITAAFIVFLAITGMVTSAWSEMSNIDEALTVAENWIDLIIAQKGNWGSSKTAEVENIIELTRGERVLGYFCAVKPKGFIIVSLRKELAPVKAYSTESTLDPASDIGFADLIKASMARILDEMEKIAGPLENIKTQNIESILEIDYRSSWSELEKNNAVFRQRLDSGEMENYKGGEILLASAWHQNDPYNLWCPGRVGSEACDHTLVGCVATAGAQIMRYWNWPPYGVGSPYNDRYDWRNMRNRVFPSSPQVQQEAVAELSYEVGDAVGMDYGCSESSAYTHDMEDVFEDHYRYSTACRKRDRSDYSAVSWFSRLKNQFNVNRPVQYRIPNHSIVGDGWQEIGGLPIRQYHMNYGWGESGTNAWYTLDALLNGNPDDEYMLENIYPAQALGNWLEGTYTPNASFPYRYFDQDALGWGAVFAAGSYLQLLPEITIRCTSPDDRRIEFIGWSNNNTLLFTKGNELNGIRIYSGHIYLYASGSIKMY